MTDYDNKLILTYKGKEYDVTSIVTTINNDDEGKQHNQACRMTLDLLDDESTKDFELIFNLIIETYCPNRLNRRIGEKAIWRQQSESQPTNTPKCPTCQSTNIKKISTTSKAVSVGLFGLFSQKVKRQFCCENCGYEW